MSTKKAKLIESAQKNLLKGQYERSITDLRQAIQLDHSDIKIRQKLAETLAKANLKDDAVKEYSAIAKHYIDSTHYLKAIAVYKQIQKIDPDNAETSLTLASLNEKQGLNGNAAAEYAVAVQIFEKTGENAKAIKALESMLAIDPNNTAARLRIAEKYIKVGNEEKSRQEFMHLAKQLKERGDETGFGHVAERIKLFFGDDIILSSITSAGLEADFAEDSLNEKVQLKDNDLGAAPSAVIHEGVVSGLIVPQQEDARIDHLELIEELDEIEELIEAQPPEIAEPAGTDAVPWEEYVDLSQISAEIDAPPDAPTAVYEEAKHELTPEIEDIELELIIEEELPPVEDFKEFGQPVAFVAPASASSEFDLGRELSAFADAIDFDLLKSTGGDAGFSADSATGFKKNELDNEDAESHYSLGLAYREMGLFDEAIGEFIVASSAPERKIDCLIMQGICLKEIGRVDKAVDFLNDLLGQPELCEDEVLGIKYELALCQEALSQPAEAKRLYKEILVASPYFSDVAERLSNL